jgi:hypothetical protein
MTTSIQARTTHAQPTKHRCQEIVDREVGDSRQHYTTRKLKYMQDITRNDIHQSSKYLNQNLGNLLTSTARSAPARDLRNGVLIECKHISKHTPLDTQVV